MDARSCPYGLNVETEPARFTGRAESVPMEQRMPKDRRRLRSIVISVGSAFLVSRVIFYLTALFAIEFIPQVSAPLAPSPLIDVSWQWDGEWFASIIRDGYSWRPDRESNVAFFPLFPAIVRGLASLLPGASFYTVGVVANNVIFLLALVAVWLYAESKSGAEVAARTVFLVSLFPTAFFFSAAYSEPVFLLTAALSMAAMQRHRYGWAGAAGFFASLARPTGVLLLIPYGIGLWSDRRRTRDRTAWTRKALPALLIPLGIGLYALYLGVQFGEPLAFAKAQEGWGREATLPLLSLYRAAVAIFAEQPHELIFYMNILNVVTSIGFLSIGIWMWRTDRAGAAFVIVATLVYLMSPVGPTRAAWDPWEGNSIQSLSRYVVTLFPALVPVAAWAAKRSSRWTSLCALFLVLHVLLASLFMRGHYVF